MTTEELDLVSTDDLLNAMRRRSTALVLAVQLHGREAPACISSGCMATCVGLSAVLSRAVLDSISLGERGDELAGT